MVRWFLDNVEILAIVLNTGAVLANSYTGKWWAALYWVGATLIAFSILKMKG
jgi:hypothetical protein